MRLPLPDKEILIQIEAMIHEDYSKNYTITELASMANMSASRFKTGFHIMFGQPVHQYILHKKMAYARRAIKEDALSLAQIARKCGYKYCTNFIAAFKKVYGYTPASIRPRIASWTRVVGR